MIVQQLTLFWSRWLGQGRWLGAFSIGLVLVIWAFLNYYEFVPDKLLPSPVRVCEAFLEIVREGYRGVSLSQNIFSTLFRCSSGFILACLVGIPLGLAMGYWTRIGAAFNFPIQFLRPLPPLSYLILLLLWLGMGNTSKVALLFMTAFPIVVSSAMAGVRSTKQQKIQAARSLGASERQVFVYVILPSALPMVFTGARIAMAAAFSTVVAAELMAATDGLGWMVFSASRFLRNDVIIVGIIILGALGMTLTKLLLWIDTSIVHWRGVE